MLTTEKQKGVISTRCELHRNFARSLFFGLSKTNVLFSADFIFNSCITKSEVVQNVFEWFVSLLLECVVFSDCFVCVFYSDC